MTISAGGGSEHIVSDTKPMKSMDLGTSFFIVEKWHKNFNTNRLHYIICYIFNNKEKIPFVKVGSMVISAGVGSRDLVSDTKSMKSVDLETSLLMADN
jgi:hypothetical protein